MPADANPQTAGAIEALGAEVVRGGDTFDDAREHADALACGQGWRYVPSEKEPR